MFAHYIGIIPRALWKLLFVLNFILSMILLWPLFFILLSSKKYRTAFKCMRVWARWVLTIPGIIPRVKREADPREIKGACIFVANHSSYLDIVVSYIAIPTYFVYMGKAEIDKAPLLRMFFKGMNIYVDRKTRSGSYLAFQLAAEKLRNGESVFIYPEGTIESKGHLKSFKNGAFRLAIENQVPIVPITFLGNWKLLQNGGFFKSHGRPGLTHVIVHKPVFTNGMTEEDLIPLRHRVREMIAKDLGQI
ncbi:MAG TPA: lysophospholipid acyltransferase family protein [Bacteroidia bacterium]|jgi:1-acyl-sn-glycerol-3-phosphate acyltransferase|nr:lysophospholipid acyltransferase family protein [Bacteroidia bacterium]